ncbi:glycosyltransferase [Micromonospora sp.]|uniref:glycosyltransferase n=1 Tax=Micromonospora sp. TaxID=1876 RepID=UPI003B3A033F
METINMLRAAQATGLDLHVVVPGAMSPQSRLAHRAALPGVEMDFIPRRTGWRANLHLTPYLFASRPLPAGLLDRLRRRHAENPYTAVLAISYRTAPLSIAIARALGLPLLVRPHNVESQYFATLAGTSRFPRNLPYLAESFKLRRAEAGIHADPTVTAFADIGERDAAWRRERTDRPVVFVPPFVGTIGSTDDRDGDDGEDLVCTSGELTLLFLGALDFVNNIDGIRWFVQRCWPALREGVDGRPVRLRVVGRNASAALVAELTAAGAEVLVDVPRVDPYLRAADVFVNPVRSGAGVNIKMIEAMSAALPVVSTSTGARGLPWRDGTELAIADEAGDFVAAVRALLVDADRRAEMSSAASEFVRTVLDPVAQMQRMRSAVGD